MPDGTYRERNFWGITPPPFSLKKRRRDIISPCDKSWFPTQPPGYLDFGRRTFQGFLLFSLSRSPSALASGGFFRPVLEGKRGVVEAIIMGLAKQGEGGFHEIMKLFCSCSRKTTTSCKKFSNSFSLHWIHYSILCFLGFLRIHVFYEILLYPRTTYFLLFFPFVIISITQAEEKVILCSFPPSFLFLLNLLFCQASQERKEVGMLFRPETNVTLFPSFFPCFSSFFFRGQFGEHVCVLLSRLTHTCCCAVFLYIRKFVGNGDRCLF